MFPMNIEVARIDTSLPLPSYGTPGSVAFDLYARTSVTVPPWQPTIIPTNLIIKVPEGFMLMLASRSSTPLKKGLMVANSVGIIDQDYHGANDEIGLLVVNFTQKDVHVERAERIGQAMLVKIQRVSEFSDLAIQSASRGGFGSTG